jgi:hypothetical protein
MATGGLYGQSSAGIVAAQTGSESSGLYGNNTVFGGTYFEWFIFQEASTQPATPTGGSWNFLTNTGTVPSGWTQSPPTAPTNEIWVSIALVNSRTTSSFTWSTPGLFGVIASTSVGTTTTGAAGTSASVTNSGTPLDAVLNFTIPRGDTGATGAAATIAAGTTTTTAPGTNATVTNVGTSGAAVFDFAIPRGAGVNSGGSVGQVLTKASGTDYDTTWTTIIGTLNYQGSWNASTNSPTLTSSVGTNGYYYVVGTAGSTNLNGITDWQVGDWAIFNGSIWQKLDQTNLVTSVAGRTGAVVLSNTDISGLGTMSTQNANAVAVTGGSIDGTAIGATSRSSADFTTLSANTVTNTTPVLSFNASNTIASFGSTTANSYNQLVIQNKSATTGASTNYVISNNLGTDSTYYGEFGMNASTYSSGTPADFFSLNNGVYFSSHDGDVTVGSGNGFKTYLAWGTVGQSAHVVNASGAIGLNTNITGTTNFGTSGQVLTSGGSTATPTWTTPTTGTVTSVSGTGTVNGLTLTGTVTTSGSLTLGGTLNLSSPPAIGGTTPAGGAFTTLTASSDPSFTSTGAVQLPSGNTAQQPTGVAGKLRFNTTTSQFEGYNGTTWASVGGAAISNDTSTATAVYPLFASATSGTALTVYTSNANYLYTPSTGELKAKEMVSSNGIVINADSVSSNYTIASGTNGFSVGPLTINSGVVLTIASGQRHVVI